MAIDHQELQGVELRRLAAQFFTEGFDRRAQLVLIGAAHRIVLLGAADRCRCAEIEFVQRQLAHLREALAQSVQADRSGL